MKVHSLTVLSQVLLGLCLTLGTSSLLVAQRGEGAEYAPPLSKAGIGIDQKLKSQIPLDLIFRDEADRPAPLQKYFGEKPVVLALVYYNCPGLCGLTLQDMVHSLRQVDLKAGQDYNVVIVSIDPKEKAALAAAKKEGYEKLFKKPGFDIGWHFLTGDQESIRKLAAAVGFRYRWDDPTHQFVHAAGIMIATPEGKLSRYFYGIQYSPTDVRLSLVEASAHKIGSAVDYVLLFCCPYDPLTGKYTVAIYTIIKLAGGITLLGLAILVYFLMRSAGKRQQRRLPRQETVGT